MDAMNRSLDLLTETAAEEADVGPVSVADLDVERLPVSDTGTMAIAHHRSALAPAVPFAKGLLLDEVRRRGLVVPDDSVMTDSGRS